MSNQNLVKMPPVSGVLKRLLLLYWKMTASIWTLLLLVRQLPQKEHMQPMESLLKDDLNQFQSISNHTCVIMRTLW